MPIADLICLLRDELLVRVDQESEKIGSFYRLDTSAKEPSQTARVLCVGPEQRFYQGGERVVLSLFAGTTLALEGIEVEDQVKVVRPEHVLALLPIKLVYADLSVKEDYGLSDIEAAEWCCAPPAHLLVEREEMPLQRGKIHIPPSTRTQTRAHEALVRHVGSGVQGFAPGERVLLTSMVLGRSIAFGIHPCRTLWLVTPGQILCKLKAEPEEGETLRNYGSHPLESWAASPELAEPDTGEVVLDEGDSRGLR
jgi:co-chaperonin GroES (HSP10)